MSIRMRIILKISLCILLAAGSYFWATASMDAIYAFRSPLDANPPQPGAALADRPESRVIIVLIDALRADTAADAQLMPVLDGLRKQGASATMHSRPPSFSTPGYGVLLTGAWPELSGAPAFNLDYAEIPPIRQDTIFAAAKRAGIQTAAAGYNYFEKLLLPETLDASFFTAGEDAAADETVIAAALPWLDSGDYGLVLIHIDQVDYAGHHQGGPLSPEWNAAAGRADALLGQILAHVDLTRDTLLVISDHGQVMANGVGGHGGQDPDTLLEPFVLVGAYVKPGSYADLQMVDVAPTVSALLGVNLPAASQGEPRVEMLNLPETVQTWLEDALISQQKNLLEHYTTAIGVPANPSRLAVAKTHADYQSMLESVQVTRRNNERGPRAVLAAALLAGTFWLVRPWRLRNFPGWLAALLVVLLFLLRYMAEGRTFSYSSLGGQADLLQLGLTGAVPAFILAWLLLVWRQRWLRLPRAEAAENSVDLALAVGLLWLLPLAAHFAWDGLRATWLLPALGLHYVFMLSAIQLIFGVLTGVLFTGLAALLARPRDGN